MCLKRVRAAAALALILAAEMGFAAELPAEVKKAKPAAAGSLPKCNIAGVAGVMAANGVCVRLGGSISAGVAAGKLR